MTLSLRKSLNNRTWPQGLFFSLATTHYRSLYSLSTMKWLKKCYSPSSIFIPSLHCPTWRASMWYLQNFRNVSASLLTQPPLEPATQPRGSSKCWEAFDWRRQMLLLRKRKEMAYFFPRKHKILHKCYFLISIHSTHREPGDIISTDLKDGEIESYARSAGSDLVARKQKLFPLFGLNYLSFP